MASIGNRACGSRSFLFIEQWGCLDCAAELAGEPEWKKRCMNCWRKIDKKKRACKLLFMCIRLGNSFWRILFPLPLCFFGMFPVCVCVFVSIYSSIFILDMFSSFDPRLLYHLFSITLCLGCLDWYMLRVGPSCPGCLLIYFVHRLCVCLFVCLSDVLIVFGCLFVCLLVYLFVWVYVCVAG